MAERARFLLQHDRNAVANGIGKAGGAAAPLLRRLIVNQRRFAARAHQQLKQAPVNALGCALWLWALIHGGHARILGRLPITAISNPNLATRLPSRVPPAPPACPPAYSDQGPRA